MRNWYYARHGKQSGPVGIEELRRLLGTGSLDVTDLVWKEGMAGWIPAGEVPELQEMLRPRPSSPPPAPPAGYAGSDNPYAPPAWQPQISNAAPQDPSLPFVPGSEPLSVETVAKHTLELTKRYWGTIFVAGLIYFAIYFAISLFVSLTEAALGYSGGESHPGNRGNSLPGTFIIDLVGWFVGSGWTAMSLELAAGRPVTMGMLFSQGPKFIRIVGANLLYLVVVFAGFLLLIFPGIYFALKYGQFQYAIVEKDMGVMESFRYSAQITEGSKANLFVLGMLTFVVVLAGILLLIAGLGFALPYVAMLQTVAYRWLSRGSRSLVQEG